MLEWYPPVRLHKPFWSHPGSTSPKNLSSHPLNCQNDLHRVTFDNRSIPSLEIPLLSSRWPPTSPRPFRNHWNSAWLCFNNGPRTRIQSTHGNLPWAEKASGISQRPRRPWTAQIRQSAWRGVISEKCVYEIWQEEKCWVYCDNAGYEFGCVRWVFEEPWFCDWYWCCEKKLILVTDEGRKFVLGVATRSDLEEFAKRRVF